MLSNGIYQANIKRISKELTQLSISMERGSAVDIFKFLLYGML